MNEITVSAKTVDDAITEASIQLGVASDQMEYEVIEKGSNGFLGIGARQAVIKARLKVVKEEKPAEKSYEKTYEKHTEKHVDKQADKRTEKRPEKRTDKYVDKRTEKRTDKPADRYMEKHTDKQVEKPVKKEEGPQKELEIVTVTEETKKICEVFLQDVLKAMDMGEVQLVSTVDADGALSIEMSGSNMGILIGKRGQTLDSLQYLTNRVANKSQEGYVRVKLDTEDYRRRRKETLENLAKNIAYKVKRTRKPVSLEPMNPYERRIIHSALQGDDRVSTHSEGEEPYRRVVVTPNRR